MPDDLFSAPGLPATSLDILTALKSSIPDAIVASGKTGLPILVIPAQRVEGELVGPVKVFWNLQPRQFRIVNDVEPKYEHRCGSAKGVLDELAILFERDFPAPPASLSYLS